MKQKRIICTVTNDLTNDQRMHRICMGLSRFYRVELVGRERTSSPNLAEKPYRQTRIWCFFETGKLFYLEYTIRLFFYLLSHRSRILYAVDLDTIIPVLLVGKLKGRCVVYDAHEYFTEVPELVGRSFEKRIWEAVAASCIPRIDIGISVSESICEALALRYQKKFHLVRNLPFYEKAPTDHQKDEKFLIYQGALNKGRGLEFLIEVADRLPLPVVIAGEGDLSRELRARVDELKLRNKVRFVGMLDPGSLRALTSRAFVGYCVMENLGMSYYLSLSNKFFDYAMAGIPSLVSPFPEYISLNERYNCALICDMEKEKFIAKVWSLYRDEALYEELCQNASAMARELNWSKEEEKLLELINSIA